MEYVYRTQGTCSTNIELNVEDGVVKEVAFWGGCNGNLQGLSRLVKGMKVEEVIKKLEGVRCSGRLPLISHFMQWQTDVLSRSVVPCTA